MFARRSRFLPLGDRGQLRVMFVITSMPVGGMETLLVNLIRRMDRTRFEPELCCLKTLGPLGEVLADEIPVFTGLISNKYDFGVWGRLSKLLRDRKIDAVIGVGTGGDKMFWSRLAGWRARLPVILSALHSTGLPDHVEWPNRLLEPLTDAFIGVATAHGNYLTRCEGCPPHKVRVIPNGVDVDRFRPTPTNPRLRAELGLAPDAPVAGILAALRPEKNHELFLRTVAKIHVDLPAAQFLVIGDGPLRERLTTLAKDLEIDSVVHFLGTRSDIPELLNLIDVLVLSSHMEANPVSILEALACGKPVVATRVGSIPESVHDGVHGYLVEPGDAREMAARVLYLLRHPETAHRLGQAGREHVVANWSLSRMVDGYQNLISEIYQSKCLNGSKYSRHEAAQSVGWLSPGLVLETFTSDSATEPQSPTQEFGTPKG
jgi:glycosyltransferase involved in cell wall biosynthesis